MVSSGLSGPVTLAFDSAGDLFIANTANSTVSVLPKASGTLFGHSVSADTLATVVSSGLDAPIGLAFDSAGDLFIANSGNSTVSKLVLSPQVLSVHATPGTLRAGGGTVTVTGRVQHATSCQLRLLSRQSFPVVYSHNPTKSCRSGSYLAHVTMGANTKAIKRIVAFVLIARNSTSESSGRFYVVLAGATPATVLSVGAKPAFAPVARNTTSAFISQEQHG